LDPNSSVVSGVKPVYAADDVDDAWQVTHFGLSNPDGHGGEDPDQDGLTNREEFTAGSDPMIAPVVVVDEPKATPSADVKLVAFQRQPGGSFRISFVGQSGSACALEQSTDLSLGSWEVAQEITAIESESETSVKISAEQSRKAFFRISERN
jgi:hypothetical protein